MVFVIVLFNNCKRDNNIITKVNNELPIDFVEFLDTFHTDSTFQMNSIIFPLEGAIRANSENTDSMIPYKWIKYKWKLHHKFNNYENIFTQKYYIFNKTTIIEKTSGVSGLFQMEKRFAKMNDRWNLIYYSVN